MKTVVYSLVCQVKDTNYIAVHTNGEGIVEHDSHRLPQ